MKRILLVCGAGMSTSLLAKKMQDESEARGLDFEIIAKSVSEAEVFGPDASVVLVGPQIRYNIEKLKLMLPSKPIEMIPIVDYGTANGKNVLNLALKLMED